MPTKPILYTYENIITLLHKKIITIGDNKETKGVTITILARHKPNGPLLPTKQILLNFLKRSAVVYYPKISDDITKKIRT